MIDDLVRPNGIIGTLDGKLLYVADRAADTNYMYTINDDSTLSGRRFFSGEGSDGMALDTEGNVYITSPRNEPSFVVSVYDSA